MLEVKLGKIEGNARNIVNLSRPYGIRVMAVTKGVSAAPEVAHAMLQGGVEGLGDSRLANLVRLRRAGIRAHLTLLRSPMLSEATRIVEVADRSLISDTPVLEVLSRAALERGRRHEAVLMVDLGDLREGFWPEKEHWTPLAVAGATHTIEEAVRVVERNPGLELVGVGVNLLCFGAVIPTVEKMEQLVRIAGRASDLAGCRLSVVSGGNSANLPLIINGKMPYGVTELRIGEGILMGTEAVGKSPVLGCVQDAFTFFGEVIEVREKPSVPLGEIGIDAFGESPEFEDRGIRRRAIIAAGRQDVDWQDMRPRDTGVFVLGASSDHLVLDVSGAGRRVEVGDRIAFDVGYSCMLRACTSEYVSKVFVP